MKSFLLVLSLAVLVFAVDESDVLVLSTDNFDEAVAKNEFLLVEFYAPWCGHCKSLTPEFAKAATELKGAATPVALAKVDATVEQDLGQRFSVQGFPTLIFFKHGVHSSYDGGRKAADIVEWCTKKSGPPTTPVTTEELDASIDGNEAVMVGFFKDKDSDLYAAFVEVAKAYSDIPYLEVSADDAMAKHTATAPSVVLFRQFEEPRVDYTGAAGKDDLLAFARKESMPPALEFNEKNQKKIFGGDIKKQAILFVDKESSDFKSLVSTFGAAGKNFGGEVVFVYINKEHENIYQYFSLDPAKDIPTLMGLNMALDMRKYKYDGAFEADKITEFVKTVVDGSAVAFLKTEDEPTEPLDGSVAVIVGKNFDRIVLDETKDVLVEFYAPWCGHCQKLAPAWEKLAKHYQGSNVVVAKLDGTKNEIEGVSVEGFPTIKYWPANDKKNPVTYDGGRTFKELKAWLAEHQTTGDADAKKEEL